MTIKNILVGYSGSETSEGALKVACGLARKFDAHLTGLMARDLVGVVPQTLLSQSHELRKIVADNEKQTMKDAMKKFEAGTEGLPNRHWRTFDNEGDVTLIEQSRYHDLTVMGQYNTEQRETAFSTHPDRVALLSGRPILVVPKGYDAPLKDEIVVAWDGERAAARALADAMQILEATAKVRVLTVGRGDNAMERPAKMLLTHLDRHGVEAEWVRLRLSGFSVARVIIEWCRENNPGLLVMGAYEHSKFREDLFGGTTNSILSEAVCPVLLSH